MAVQKSCNPDKLVFNLNVAAQEKLRHTVTSTGSVTWVLQQDEATLLEGSADDRKKLEWPDTTPADASVKHSLGIQFVGPGDVTWQIERLFATGTVIETIKKCTYDNPDGNDDHFDNVKIRIA